MSAQEFEIGKLIELARHKKYELTSAGFAALDKIERIAVPKKLKTRKIAVQALHALSEGMIRYGYFTPEEKKKLQAEANLSDAPYKGFKGLFSNAAPVVEEDIEEDFIPQEEDAKHDFVADSDGDESDSATSDDEEEDEEEEEEEEDTDDEDEDDDK